jgi:hypothetical protein
MICISFQYCLVWLDWYETSMGEADKKPRSESTNLSVPYSTVALGAGLVAAACLAALVVVASAKDADALATIALALAVITFIVQLVVYVAQAVDTRRNNELTQTLHAQLTADLGELTGRAKGTEATMATISDKLLDRALQQTGSSKLENLPPGFARDLASNLAELMEDRGDTDQGSEAVPQTEFPEKPWGPDEDHRVRRMLSTWPEDVDELGEIQENLDGLPDFALTVLDQAARDELEYRAADQDIRPCIVSASEVPTAKLLYERELLEDLDRKAYSVALSALTEKGRKVARIFVAEGKPPEEIADLVHTVRQRAQDRQDLLSQQNSFANGAVEDE